MNTFIIETEQYISNITDKHVYKLISNKHVYKTEQYISNITDYWWDQQYYWWEYKTEQYQHVYKIYQ